MVSDEGKDMTEDGTYVISYTCMHARTHAHNKHTKSIYKIRSCILD